MTTEPTTTPKPRRRWLQFSLRALFFATLVVSVGTIIVQFNIVELQRSLPLHPAAIVAVTGRFQGIWLATLLGSCVVAILASDNAIKMIAMGFGVVAAAGLMVNFLLPFGML
jgi:hypothetical protein